MPQPGQVISSAGNQLCGIFQGPGGVGQEMTVQCAAGVTGRYLVIQLMGRQYLHLCEVEVYGGGPAVAATAGGDYDTNFAIGQPTAQSSTGWDGQPGRAVDGNRDGQYWHLSCQHTLADNNPWWAVDLGTDVAISRVVMINRADCCASRTANLQIYTVNSMPSPGAVLSSGGNQMCGTFQGPGGAGQEMTVTCAEGVYGRYLVVQLMGQQYLHLCEVEVYGGGSGGPAGGGDCEAAEALQAELDAAAAENEDLAARVAELEQQLAQKNQQLQNSQGDAAKLATAEAALAACQADKARLEKELEAALQPGPDPIMPTASPTATLSDTGYRFTLPLNGIEYILETTPQHVALKADDFCEQYGMKLAQVENDETRDALYLQLKAIQNKGASLTEVATGERSAVNLDRDVATDAFNAAGWSCVTFVPDGDSFKTVSKKCQGERAILCAAVPLYC